MKTLRILTGNIHPNPKEEHMRKNVLQRERLKRERKLKSALLCAFALAVVASAAAPASALLTCPDPGPFQVAIYQNADFSDGGCSVLDFFSRQNPYENSADFGIGNDSISSLKVGSEVTVTLFEHTFYSGQRLTLGPGLHSWVGSAFNDQTSSVRLQPRTQNCLRPGFGNVALFQHADFKGDCTVKPTGTFNNTAALGIANDSISSLIVGGGVIVKVCSDANLGGRCERFGNGNNVRTLVGSLVRNDAITSIELKRVP